MKKYIYLGLLIAALGIGGCGTLDLFSKPDGTIHTQLTDTLETVSGIVVSVGSFIPGYGLIATGISALLGIIGSGILAFRTKSQGNKLNTAGGVLKTMVTGINVSTDNYEALKQSIILIAKGIDADEGKEIVNIFNKFEEAGSTVKDTIKNLSVALDTKIDVASAVAKVEGKI